MATEYVNEQSFDFDARGDSLLDIIKANLYSDISPDEISFKDITISLGSYQDTGIATLDIKLPRPVQIFTEQGLSDLLKDKSDVELKRIRQAVFDMRNPYRNYFIESRGESKILFILEHYNHFTAKQFKEILG